MSELPNEVKQNLQQMTNYLQHIEQHLKKIAEALDAQQPEPKPQYTGKLTQH